MKSGIYCIENIIDGKKYIGQTSNLERRKSAHLSMLRGNYHTNKHLQNSWNKYGEDSFEFKILLYCDVDELTYREQFFVDKYMPEVLYNKRIECVDSNRGFSHSEETKQKISKAHSGENSHMFGTNLSEKTKNKLSKAHLGKKHSKKTKEKMSKANSGENNPNYGKTPSKETREKMSRSQSGEKNHNFGKIFSKEIKEKMSKAKSGENSSNSKITEKDAFEILDLYYNKKVLQKEIAEIFPLNRSSIHNIIRGKRWEDCYKAFMEKNKGALYGNKN